MLTDKVISIGSLSDFELLSLFQNGDRKAYEEIYHRYWAIIFRHARKMLQDDEAAKDIVQDVFSAFWTNGPRLNIGKNISGYLYSSLRYKFFDLIDRQKVRNDYLLSLERFIDTMENSPDYRVRERELQEIIEKEVDALPEKMREVFILSRKANLSYKQIAESLEISENTVKKQINNALKILRSRLGTTILMLFF